MSEGSKWCGTSALLAAASEVFDAEGRAIKSRNLYLEDQRGPPSTIDGFTVEEINAELAAQGDGANDANCAQHVISALFSLHRKRNLRNAT